MSLSSFQGLKFYLGLSDFTKFDEGAEFSFNTPEEYTVFNVQVLTEQAFKALPPTLKSTSGHIYVSSEFKKTDGSLLIFSQVIENDAIVYTITICHDKGEEYVTSSFISILALNTFHFKIEKPGLVLHKKAKDLYPPGESILQTLTVEDFRSKLYHGLVGILT